MRLQLFALANIGHRSISRNTFISFFLKKINYGGTGGHFIKGSTYLYKSVYYNYYNEKSIPLPDAVRSYGFMRRQPELLH